VQDLRKTSGLRISDRIVVKYVASARIAEAVEAHAQYLRNELLAERIERCETLAGGARLSLAGEEIAVSVDRIA
jgi:isoleucyl-tRNA synthetase